MALSTWTGSGLITEPFFNQMERAMDIAFDRAFGGRSWPVGGNSSNTTAFDIVEHKDHYALNCDAPGISADYVKVEHHDGVLTVSGERRSEKQHKETKMWRNERQWIKFTRSFVLPENINADAITASLDKGVLSVTVPKLEQPKTQPKRIQVQSSL